MQGCATMRMCGLLAAAAAANGAWQEIYWGEGAFGN